MRQMLVWTACTASFVAAFACSQAAQTRQSSVGQALGGDNSAGTTATNGAGTNAAGTAPATTPASGNALPADPSTAPGGTGGTSPGTITTTPTGTGKPSNAGGGTSKTLEQCQAAGQAWRAVVAGGTQPSDCVDQLVSWCCTRDEVKNHFPTMAAELEMRFQHYLDTNSEVLYACSVDSSNAYSFSMAKIVGGTTTYDVITVSAVTPVTPANSTPANMCAPVTTAQLLQTSLNLNDSLDEKVGQSSRDPYSK